ncbi:MAG: response regulator [Chloroflexi bacterium CFX4]|nr:response regulator [Chloroflexi bacterium CFX4]MDL1922729.1 response regulator [Chloroflexi bacterium CFX3]
MPDALKQILVVDDNEANRDVLTRRLERQGFSVTVAEDGAQALEKVRASTFDLILLDIMMPRLNGYEVLETIKRDPALRHMPIIMISAVDELDSVVRCIELGAEDYLFKPFNPVLLKARVNATLQRYGSLLNLNALRDGLENIQQRAAALTESASENAQPHLSAIQAQADALLALIRAAQS